MRLVVFSHKSCWPGREAGMWATDGGFPKQMAALAACFDETVLAIPGGRHPTDAGGTPLTGPGLSVFPLTAIRGRGWARKLLFPFWVLRNGIRLVRALRKADVVHAAIPGDVGLLGMWLAVVFRKRLFVRHCGNWDRRGTRMDRFGRWSMRRFAGPPRPMFATGLREGPPAPGVPHLGWIFATSIAAVELDGVVARTAPEQTPTRWLVVARVEAGKGIDAVLAALAHAQAEGDDVHLDVVGDGEARRALEARAQALGVGSRVSWHGTVPQSDVRDHLVRAHLFLLLSRSEGFPKAVIEALATALPVVATNVSAIPQILAGGGGLVVDDTAPGTVSAATRRLVGDGDLYARTSAAALVTARCFTLDAWQASLATTLQAAFGPLRTAGPRSPHVDA